MDGFERRKEQSKGDIRRAAEELFSRFGADKVSVNDIARKAGVSQATIYNNFGSKENLVRDYHGTIIEKIASSFRGVIVMKKSWVEKFQDFLQSWLDIADRYRIEVGASEAEGDAGSIGADIDGLFRQFIKEGKEQGSLSAELSEEAVITYIKFFQQGITMNQEIREKMLRNAGFSRDLISLFLYGIQGQAG
jgi:AcrR family transcriptional regulator